MASRRKLNRKVKKHEKTAIDKVATDLVNELSQIAPHVREIEKRINDEPGFQVNKIVIQNIPNLYVFHIEVGHIIVMHMYNITADLPVPDDVIISLRDEYSYVLQ